MDEGVPVRETEGEESGRRWVVGSVAVVVLLTLVGLVVGVNWVLNLGCGCSPPAVHAGASVEAASDDDRVTVTFASNQDASHLVVRVESDGGAVRVTEMTGDATVTDDGVRLATIGDAVTYAGTDPAANTMVTLRVVAYPRDGDDAAPQTIAYEEVYL